MLENIHAHWKRKRVCKIKCKGVCTVDMDNVCEKLEVGGIYIFYPLQDVVTVLVLWNIVTPSEYRSLQILISL